MTAPTISKGDNLQPRFGRRMSGAVAIEDSRLARDCFGELVEKVRYRHNPSGRWPCPDWHYCDGSVSAFVVEAGRIEA